MKSQSLAITKGVRLVECVRLCGIIENMETNILVYSVHLVS